MSDTKWSDNKFLDELREQSDAAADAVISELEEVLEKRDFSKVFEDMNANDEPLPENMPPQLSEFFDKAIRLPKVGGVEVDKARLIRGEKVFMTHAFPSAMVLLAKSLPEGYAALNLSRILVLSGNLSHHPYKRLLGVLQMVINVNAVGGFKPNGKAIVTAAKMRLLHAGVRTIVRRRLPDYEQEYGIPVNFEDMLGTIMGFSLLVITGLQRLRVGLTDQEAEDLYYTWRVFAQTAGIHPQDEPDNSEFVPANLTEATEFYAAYGRRHYVAATENPEGVELAKANLNMINDMLPQTPLRRLGLKIVPRIYMQFLMGNEGCRRVGIRPVPWLPVTKWVLLHLPGVWVWFWEKFDRLDKSGHVHERLSRWFFQGLINKTQDGEVTFLIPDDLTELRKLAVNPNQPTTERRASDRRKTQVPITFTDRRIGRERRQSFRATYWLQDGAPA